MDGWRVTHHKHSLQGTDGWGVEEEGTAVLLRDLLLPCVVGVQIPHLLLMSQLKIKLFQAPC